VVDANLVISLASNRKDTLTTKVTIPIDYSNPLPLMINNFRENLVAKGMKEKEIDETLDLYRKELSVRGHATPVSFLGETLVGHSAQKIYLVDLGGCLTNTVLSELSGYLKSRIEWVDGDQKIQRSVWKMLDPISEELAPIWEEVRKQNGAKATDLNGHEHGFCLLGEFLTTMSIASKYDTEADANLDIVTNAINRIRRQITSSESRALLARIDGIINCYQISTQIPCIMPKNHAVPKDLLLDLLDDAKTISLSRSRYLLGIPGKFEITVNKIKRKLGEILSEPRTRRHLAMAAKLGNIATKRVNVELPEMDIERKKTFSPPLISLEEIKPKCLSTRRELPDLDPSLT
jgi:hypothetical protein